MASRAEGSGTSIKEAVDNDRDTPLSFKSFTFHTFSRWSVEQVNTSPLIYLIPIYMSVK